MRAVEGQVKEILKAFRTAKPGALNGFFAEHATATAVISATTGTFTGNHSIGAFSILNSSTLCE